MSEENKDKLKEERGVASLIFVGMVRAAHQHGNSLPQILLRIILRDEGGYWSVTSLSNLTGYDRRTLRDHLRSMERRGEVTQSEDHRWAVTNAGIEASIANFARFWNGADDGYKKLIRSLLK